MSRKKVLVWKRMMWQKVPTRPPFWIILQGYGDWLCRTNTYEEAKIQSLLRKTSKGGNNKNQNLFQFYTKTVYIDILTQRHYGISVLQYWVCICNKWTSYLLLCNTAKKIYNKRTPFKYIFLSCFKWIRSDKS